MNKRKTALIKIGTVVLTCRYEQDSDAFYLWEVFAWGGEGLEPQNILELLSNDAKEEIENKILNKKFY